MSYIVLINFKKSRDLSYLTPTLEVFTLFCVLKVLIAIFIDFINVNL